MSNTPATSRPYYSQQQSEDQSDRDDLEGLASQSQSGSSVIAKASPRSSSSDSPQTIPTLSPAPAFLEQHRRPKDDAFLGLPETPKRPGLGLRGVSLQLSMPSRDTAESTTPNASPYKSQRVPLSPNLLDTSVSYSPGGSVLPRRSRGLDYTRACTSLHHSTLAEQSSPDSSPVIGSKGMSIPRRGHSGNSGPDSPMFPTSHWSTSNNADAKNVISSSVGSVNMLVSGSDTSSSDDDMVGDEEDTVHVIPQPFKSNSNIFGITTGAGGSMDTVSPFQQAAASLMSFQRRARRTRSTRHSSSSASGRSSMASPIPGSPPLHKSTENVPSSAYSEKELKNKKLESRRESLSLGTGDLHISDSIEEDNDASQSKGAELDSSSNAEERRNVIRRAVTRRSNMLPKPKTFARIRAALQEEVSPIDTECKREAEVIRQVRESDHSPDSTVVTTQPPTTVSSPTLQPTNANSGDAVDEIREIMSGESSRRERSVSSSFSKQALRNSIGSDFWSQLDARVRTPPPPPLFGRGSSSGISEDVTMDTPASSVISVFHTTTRNSSPSRSTTPQPSEGTRKALGKRRRDDDLDPYLYKRRAVSPGISHQNSPVLPPSPAQRETLWPTKTGGEQRTGSSGSASHTGSLGKRVGLQGMTDTNDGLMNMSIE